MKCRAISSGVEHYIDIVGVTGSNPVSPISLAGEQKSMKSIVVVGLGRSEPPSCFLQGRSHSSGIAIPGQRQCISIAPVGRCPSRLSPDSRSVCVGTDPLDQVVISPGIPWDHPTLGSLRKRLPSAERWPWPGTRCRIAPGSGSPERTAKPRSPTAATRAESCRTAGPHGGQCGALRRRTGACLQLRSSTTARLDCDGDEQLSD